MKKTFILIALMISIAEVQAQRSEVRNAYSHLSTGNLSAARKAIDQASKQPKVANSPRTLLYKSFIYSGIALDTNNKGNVLGELEESWKAIEKIDKKNRGGSISDTDIDDAYNRLFTASYNRGMRAYKDENLRDALKYFEFASRIKTRDTSLYLNQAVIAQKLFDKEKAIKAYEQLLKMDYSSPQIYRNLGKLYMESDKGAEAYRIFQEGRSAFPDNSGLIFDELDFFLKNADPVEAIEMIQNALEHDDSNPSVWYSLGVAYMQAGAIGDAEDAFAKAVELKPDYYKAIYNIGLIYYNSASKILKKANDKSRFISQSEYNIYKDDYMAELQVAEDYFEKAYQLNPKDVNLLMPLREVYVRTGQASQAEKIRAEIYLLDYRN